MTTGQTRDRHQWASAAALVLLALAAGAPALRGGWLGGDDQDLILNFGLVNHPSLAHAGKLLTLEPHRYLYQPVPLLTFSGEFALLRALGLSPLADGANAGAWLFHLTNILIHAINVLLVWRLITRLHDDRRVGWIVAALFAVHPLAVEATAWLNGRMISLATLFSLMAILAIDAWDRHPSRPRAVSVLVCVVLAMASKVQVALPLLMVLMPLVRRTRPRRQWWLLWSGCVAITAGFTALNAHLPGQTQLLTIAAESLEGSRIARTALALAWYLTRLVCPVGLAHFHPAEMLVTWSSPGVWPAALAVLATLVAVGISARWTRVGWVGLIWFLAVLAPTLPLVPSRSTMVAERYAYLASVGLLWPLAALAVVAVRRFRAKPLRWGACTIGAAYGIVLLGLTWDATAAYRNDIALFTRIVKHYPDAPRTWERLGWVYYEAQRYPDAITAAQREIENHPESPNGGALHLIGMTQYRLGHTEDAIGTLQAAIAADPQRYRPYLSLGDVFEDLGRRHDAAAMFARAVELSPRSEPALCRLANVYRSLGRTDEAADHYARALVENPYNPVAAVGLAEIEMQRGQHAAAASRLEHFVAWMPEHWQARINLGVCYAAMQRLQDATRQYRLALQANPRAETAAINLAGLLANTGDAGSAIGVIQQAVAVGATDRNLLWLGHELLVAQDRLPEAAKLWTDALRREPEAVDLRAGYAWTCVLDHRWDLAADQAAVALKADPADPVARLTSAMVTLSTGDPRPALALVDGLTADDSPDIALARNRIRGALAGYGAANPNEPWPYCLMARLLLNDGDRQTAELGMQQFRALCTEEPCQSFAERLGLLAAPVRPVGTSEGP